jgi:hypothetical protein
MTVSGLGGKSSPRLDVVVHVCGVRVLGRRVAEKEAQAALHAGLAKGPKCLQHMRVRPACHGMQTWLSTWCSVQYIASVVRGAAARLQHRTSRSHHCTNQGKQIPVWGASAVIRRTPPGLFNISITLPSVPMCIRALISVPVCMMAASRSIIPSTSTAVFQPAT